MIPALQIDTLVKRFGGILATDHLSLDIRPGELHAVIGPNGAGKTTLIHQISGLLRSDAGTIAMAGEGLGGLPMRRRALKGLARSFQISSVFPEFTVMENVMLAVQARSGHSFRFWRALADDEELAAPAREAIALVGLEELGDRPVHTMAYGAKRQLELAMALAMQPQVLLLDEPMAGMSRTEALAVVALLKRLKGRYAILLVEHDMEAVFALADRITVMVYGKPIACGTPDEVRRDPKVREAYLGEHEEEEGVQ